MSKYHFLNFKKIPDIATRCAVFAKTDLIHAQQEGYGIEQICDGLCYGLAKNISNTLFTYKNIGKKIIFCGGVSSNISVKNHLEKITDDQFIIDPESNSFEIPALRVSYLWFDFDLRRIKSHDNNYFP